MKFELKKVMTKNPNFHYISQNKSMSLHRVSCSNSAHARDVRIHRQVNYSRKHVVQSAKNVVLSFKKEIDWRLEAPIWHLFISQKQCKFHVLQKSNAITVKMDKLDRRLDQVILQSSHFQTRIQTLFNNAKEHWRPGSEFHQYLHPYLSLNPIPNGRGF